MPGNVKVYMSVRARGSWMALNTGWNGVQQAEMLLLLHDDAGRSRRAEEDARSTVEAAGWWRPDGGRLGKRKKDGVAGNTGSSAYCRL